MGGCVGVASTVMNDESGMSLERFHPIFIGIRLKQKLRVTMTIESIPQLQTTLVAFTLYFYERSVYYLLKYLLDRSRFM